MQWRKTILSDNTNVNVSSFAYGNGYYIALNASQYVINIMYTQNLQDEWIVQTIKNSGADPITTAGIVFDGSKFIVPYTTTLTKALSALYFETPTDTVTDRVVVGGYTRPIALNSVRYLGGEVVVCGARQEAFSNAATSAYIWHCADPAGDWYAYRILEYTPGLSGNTLAAVYDTVSSEYQVYVVAKQDGATNIHRIYTSPDLATWSEPRTVTTDTLASPPHPAFAYCENYDAIALFLHGRIYVSKAGQAFTALAYPAGIEDQSIRTATSDGTKFLAPSASLNQASLKVIYSSGDPTVADNWRVQTLSVGTQVSPDAAFLPDINLFMVLAGANSNILKPALYTAVYLASDFNMMRDRVPTYPGRVSLTPAGQENVYTLVREDNPTEVGTKLSKVNLLSDDAALAVWNNTPPNVLCTPSTALEHLGNNAFHVGDILTTVRDLSTDENWLKCDGSEIDATKYPELADLFGGAVVPGEWEKGGFITPSSEGGGYPSWQFGIANGACKSTSYYGVLQSGQNAYPGYGGTNTYSVRYTDDKMSNGWNTIQIASWNGGGPGSPMPEGAWYIYPSTLSFVNNTWVCTGSASQNFYNQQTVTIYNRIWYCRGDIPSSFTPSSTATGCATGKTVYGKGYYVCSADFRSLSNTYPGVVYGTDIANMQTQKQLSTNNGGLRDLVFANNTFVMLHVNGSKIDVIYCTGIPSDPWTTVTATVLTSSPQRASIAYIAPYWMIFYNREDERKPYVCYTDNLSSNWTVVDAPWYDGSSSYSLASSPAVAFSDSTVMVLGRKNDTFYTWYGSSPVGNWKEIPATTELRGMQPQGISYSGGEWLMPQQSGSNYYLGYRSDNSAPNLPYLKPGLNMTTYIKAKEGD